MKFSDYLDKQKELDDLIVAKKGLEGQNLYEMKVIAFVTELGEMLNEWRGFKLWSDDRDRRRGKNGEDLVLEEFVDIFHFLFSLGNEYLCKVKEEKVSHNKDVMDRCWENEIDVSKDLRVGDTEFEKVYVGVENLITFLGKMSTLNRIGYKKESFNYYLQLIGWVVYLYFSLGFVIEDLEVAYMKKYKENQLRQENGY